MDKVNPAIEKREVGERVNLHLGFAPELTKDLGEGVLEAVVTTNSIDRTGEVIDTEGVDTSSYEKIGNVLYGHDYQGLPIGKPLSLTKMKNKIKVRFQMATKEYPFAQTVYDLVKGGYLNAVSIGGIVKQWSEDYTKVLKMEMVEFSIVPVPANSEAVIFGRSLEKATGKSFETIKSEFEDFSSKVMLDKVKSMGDDEVEDAIKVLKNLLARLEESASAPTLKDAKPTKHIRRFILKDAQAVATQSQRVIKTIKLSIKD